MISQKSQPRSLTGGGWFKQELKFLVVFLALISFSNLIFSNNTSALFVPTLSASVNQAIREMQVMLGSVLIAQELKATLLKSRKNHPVYVKIIHMISQKSQPRSLTGGGGLNRN